VKRLPTPVDEPELLSRANSLAGVSLLELATQMDRSLPQQPRRAKGWIGLLVEQALGADGACRAVPDFTALGVELKTIPVDRRGRCQESTFVCTISLGEIGQVEWEGSRVRRKLARVLWVPVEAEPGVSFGDRRLGHPLLWSPSAEEEADLRFDWEELAGLIGRGEVDRITGHLGKYLQVRPKAASSRSRCVAADRDGTRELTLPRGFYLRARFTQAILQRHLMIPDAS
jgi:DNA mismatch repair protein MutH